MRDVAGFIASSAGFEPARPTSAACYAAGGIDVCEKLRGGVSVEVGGAECVERDIPVGSEPEEVDEGGVGVAGFCG